MKTRRMLALAASMLMVATMFGQVLGCMGETDMSEDRSVVVRGISWRDLCPWLVIFRVFDLSIRLPILFLATCGVLLAPVGWRGAELLFVSKQAKETDLHFAGIVAYNNGWRPAKELPVASPSDQIEKPDLVRWLYEESPINSVYRQLVRPYWHFFTASQLSVTKIAYLGFGSLWMLLVWGFFGGVITRMAVVQFGRDETIEMGDACRFVFSRFRSYVLAPLFPFGGVLMVLFPCFLLGLLMRLNVGLLVAALIWPLVVLGGLIITALLLGLLLGWPLMWVVISGQEAGDEFEAIHRSYGYTFQRPLHYLFYIILSVVFGTLCWFLVDRFAEGVIYFSHWATAWGMPRDRSLNLWEATQISSTLTTSSLGYGAPIIGWWDGLVRSIAIAFGYGFFWCAASAVYLLIRRDVDDTEFDDVYVRDEEELRSLPPLKVDAAGVPAIVDSPPPAPSAATTSSTSGSPATDSAGEASQG